MSDAWDHLDEHTRALLDRFRGEGVVAVWAALGRALRGNGNAAILLSQLVFLARRFGDDEGWYYQSQQRLEAQTGLGPDAQRKAVRLLVRLGVLETDRRGVPAKLYYRVNLPELAALLLQHGQPMSVTDYARQQDPDYSLELDRDDDLQQVAEDGQRQAAGHGPEHIKIIKENRKESKKKISASHPQGANTAPKKPGRQSSPKHPLPDDFAITAAMRAWAADHAPQVDLDHETLKLIAWARAKGEWRSDWVATWRLWLLNAAKPGLQGQRRAPSPPARHAGIRTWVDQKRQNLGASS